MFSFISHLKFLFNSTNQHGVHSPFVYNYVTQCLYSKSKLSRNKTENVLLKSISYFRLQNILVHGKKEKIGPIISSHYPKMIFIKKPYDIVYFDSIKENTPKIKDIHNDSLFIINDIHASAKNETLWEQVKKMKEVQITLDLFYCGVVFFRKEQAKEHFKIRI